MKSWNSRISGVTCYETSSSVIVLYRTTYFVCSLKHMLKVAQQRKGIPFLINSIMIDRHKKQNPYEIKIYWFLISYSPNNYKSFNLFLVGICCAQIILKGYFNSYGKELEDFQFSETNSMKQPSVVMDKDN